MALKTNQCKAGLKMPHFLICTTFRNIVSSFSIKRSKNVVHATTEILSEIMKMKNARVKSFVNLDVSRGLKNLVQKRESGIFRPRLH